MNKKSTWTKYARLSTKVAAYGQDGNSYLVIDALVLTITDK